MSLIITELGSILLCCWNHKLDLSLKDLIEENNSFKQCMAFLGHVNALNAGLCPFVGYNRLIRKDLPLPDKIIDNPECLKLSNDVVALVLDNHIACIWRGGNFDMGVNPIYQGQEHISGLFHKRMCSIFHNDCQVWNCFTVWYLKVVGTSGLA